ncbi:ATPase, F0 complex, subunit J [Cantharellus anzutake]|uniref:ATPase, F0 complex, subunit J n=1 Tax=Cantharellus anzutake TaxID=1750568 RepID=UPI001907C67F|nr:ATPase, F0 complex, subunit J [Cantharellus anzutake]KAF8337533.1 ATPase, F0 complex, subunit J [Cantharellus anzutake]
MFGLRPWPTPILRPMWPFFAATIITTYGIVKMQNSLVGVEPHASNPKNPYAAKVAAEKAHH